MSRLLTSLFAAIVLVLAAAAKPAKRDAAAYRKLIGGGWTDPNHYRPDGSYTGVRFAGFSDDDMTFTFVGSDDGDDFWRAEGSVESFDEERAVVRVDFSEKGGPANFMGNLCGGEIHWQDGNVWEKRDFELKPNGGLERSYDGEHEAIFG